MPVCVYGNIATSTTIGGKKKKSKVREKLARRDGATEAWLKIMWRKSQNGKRKVFLTIYTTLHYTTHFDSVIVKLAIFFSPPHTHTHTHRDIHT